MSPAPLDARRWVVPKQRALASDCPSGCGLLLQVPPDAVLMPWTQGPWDCSPAMGSSGLPLAWWLGWCGMNMWPPALLSAGWASGAWLPLCPSGASLSRMISEAKTCVRWLCFRSLPVTALPCPNAGICLTGSPFQTFPFVACNWPWQQCGHCHFGSSTLSWPEGWRQETAPWLG